MPKRRAPVPQAALALAACLTLVAPLPGAVASPLSSTTLTGYVDTSTSLPRGGITVTAVPAVTAGTEDFLTPPAATQTAADGSFTLGGLIPGPYFVSVAGPASSPLGGGVWNDSALLIDDAPSTTGAVTLTAGQVTNLNITLPPGHLVSGTLTGPTGGLPGVALWLCAPSSGPCAPAGTSTDATGGFGLEVPPGTFELQFVGPAGSLGYYARPGLVLDPRLATPITVGSSDITGLKATLPDPIFSLAKGSVVGLAKPGGAIVSERLAFTGIPLTPAGVTNALRFFANGTSTAQATTTGSALQLSAPVGLADALLVQPSGGPTNHFYAPFMTPPFLVSAIPALSSQVHYSGRWASQADSAAPGGHVAMLNTTGSSATTSFKGFTYAWVAFTGPHEGRAKVYEDGALLGSVNLFSSTTHERTIVLSDGTSAEAAATHSIKIVNAGGGPVSIEGLLYAGPVPGSPRTVALTVTMSGTGGGTVGGYGPIDCGPTCMAIRSSPSVLALMARPDPDSVFVSWNSTACGRDLASPLCAGSQWSSLTIDARFDKKPPTGPPFQVAVSGSHHHNGPGDSTLFGCVATIPAQPSSPFSYTIDGPSGHASGTGTLDAMGDGTFQSPISSYGTYTETVSVQGQAGTVTGSVQYTVGAAQASGTC